MRNDIGTHYPTGLRDDAVGLFNLTLAAVALVTKGERPVERWIPVVLAWSRSASALSWWRPAFWACRPLVLFYFTWRGASIYLPLAAFSFFAVGLHDLRHRGEAGG